jgi:hypothetical protein
LFHNKITVVPHKKYAFLLVKKNKLVRIKYILFDLESVLFGVENVLFDFESVQPGLQSVLIKVEMVYIQQVRVRLKTQTV